jgi:hypothetical protein
MPAEEKLGLTVLSRNAEMKQQFSSFMGKLLENMHQPTQFLCVDDAQELWYLPFFGVYHPH